MISDLACTIATLPRQRCVPGAHHVVSSLDFSGAAIGGIVIGQDVLGKITLGNMGGNMRMICCEAIGYTAKSRLRHALSERAYIASGSY